MSKTALNKGVDVVGSNIWDDLNPRLTGVLLITNCLENRDKPLYEGLFLECSCIFSNCCVNCSNFILNGSIVLEATSSAAVNNCLHAKWCFIPAEDLASL